MNNKMSVLSFICFIITLSLFLFVDGTVGEKSFWEPSHNIQNEIKKKWKNLNVEYCQTFPQLSKIPESYAPLLNLIQQFNNNISNIMSATGAPSVTVNLVYDQDILWTQGYGLKNLTDPAAGIPDGDTLYQIGSNTKLFTALLALIAQDKGILTFNDEVSAHVPDFAPINPFPSKKSIIFNQLASHMAGLQRQSPCEAFQGNCNFTNSQMWPRIRNTTLVNPPGLIPQYSNFGFAVLGHALEEILGVEWDQLIQDEIFTPLGMTNSGTNNDDEKFIKGRAVGYTVGNVTADLWNIGWESPAGSIYSSTNDLAKFVSLCFRDDVPYMQQPNQILDSLSIREWRQPRYINNDLSGYGIPWEILSTPVIYTKGGSMKGYLSLIITVPQLKLGLIILQSSDAVLAYGDIFEMWMVSFLPSFSQMMQDLSPPPVIPPSFKQFIGSYEIFNVSISITIEQGEKYSMPVISNAAGAFLLEFISDYEYKISTQSMHMSCNSAEAGFEQYLYFIPSSPPSFTIPGLFPDTVAIKIS